MIVKKWLMHSSEKKKLTSVYNRNIHFDLCWSDELCNKYTANSELTSRLSLKRFCKARNKHKRWRKRET